MYHSVIYIVCIFVALKTFSYSLWSFKNTGAAGGCAVLVMALFCIAPLFMLAR